MTFKGRLLLAHFMLKLFSAENFQVPSKSGLKMAGFGEMGGVNVKFWFCDAKRHILSRNPVFWRILLRCPWWRLGCRWLL